MRKLIYCYVLVLSLCACQNASSDFSTAAKSMNLEEMQIPSPRTAEPPAPPPISETNDQEQNIRNSIAKASKIIKDGDIRVEVSDLQAAKARMDSTLKTFEGYYEKENYQNQRYQSSYYLTIRLPAAKFDTFLSTIEKGDGKITEKQIQARDVTEEYVDIAVRLNNNQTYLNRYRELLKKANSVKEILEIQEKIRQIEEEIDARKGRLQYLDDKVRFSTLRIELIQFHELVAERKARNFGQQVLDAFRDGIDAFLDFTLFLVNIWPFLLIAGIVWFFRKRISWRFWRRKKTTT